MKIKITIKKEVAPAFNQFMKERQAFTQNLKESGKTIANAKPLSPKFIK